MLKPKFVLNQIANVKNGEFIFNILIINKIYYYYSVYTAINIYFTSSYDEGN